MPSNIVKAKTGMVTAWEVFNADDVDGVHVSRRDSQMDAAI